MLLPPLKFGEHAVNDINKKSCPHWRKKRGAAPGTRPQNMGVAQCSELFRMAYLTGVNVRVSKIMWKSVEHVCTVYTLLL